MKNRIVIEKLAEYYLKHSDFETVAKGLAAVMIDYNRFINYMQLDAEERACFIDRCKRNARVLQKFVQNDFKCDSKLKLINMTGEKSAEI
jgi:hypothetical protein